MKCAWVYMSVWLFRFLARQIALSVLVAGSAGAPGPGGPVARQPRRRQPDRDRGAAPAQISPTNHVDDPAASLRPEGHAQRVQSRLADAPPAVQYHW